MTLCGGINRGTSPEASAAILASEQRNYKTLDLPLAEYQNLDKNLPKLNDLTDPKKMFSGDCFSCLLCESLRATAAAAAAA